MPKYIPVGISNRHIHLSSEHIRVLFGCELTLLKSLVQPNQFAANETVTLVGPKGLLEKVRVLGPARKETQVEILMSDTFKLGIPAELRLSGDLNTTTVCKIVGPAGEVILEK